MKAIILQEDEFNNIIKRLDDISKAILDIKKHDDFITNEDFITLMGISRRTAQTWRDDGIVSFSQIGGKIYYKQSDLDLLLENNKNIAFKYNNK